MHSSCTYIATITTMPFAVVEFDDSCDESQTLIEVIPSKWLFDNNKKCKYPSKKDKLKTTRLVMSRMDLGEDWNSYNLQFHHYYSTYNTALKATKSVLEGEVARTEAETDYDQPRKRKKNKKYILTSSEDDEVDNPPSHVPRGTSTEIPAPDSLLPNKLRALLNKNKSIKMSAKREQRNTSVGKLFSHNESRNEDLKSLKLTHCDIALDENPTKQHSSLTEAGQQSLSPKVCSIQMAEKCVTTELLQSKKTEPPRKLQRVFQHLDKENCLKSFNISQNDSSPLLNIDDYEGLKQPTTSDGSSMSMGILQRNLGKKRNLFSRNISKSKSPLAFDDYDKINNKHNENFTNTTHSKTLQDKTKDDVSEEERTIMFEDNENQTSQNLPFQGLSNADRDLLMTTLSHLKKLNGPVVSNLDRDLLRDVSSKLDMVLMNQRRILNEIFPNEATVERPENCPPLPLRDERSFQDFNEFLKNKLAYSQFVSYLSANIIDDSDQWTAATCLMSIILHNELSRQISWKGTRGMKISFYGTRIKEAVFCAIMSRFENQSLKNAEEAMKRWLNTSGQRK